jgi:multidrug efflux system outer membrane protein
MSGAWLFEPEISVPIFAGGENLANLDIVNTNKKIEIANYEKAIQSAFHDVSDALAGRSTYQAQEGAEAALVARNALFSAQLSLVSLKLVSMQNEVTLYKALGGGWQEKSQAGESRRHCDNMPLPAGHVGFTNVPTCGARLWALSNLQN